jgi:cation transport ATPase
VVALGKSNLEQKRQRLEGKLKGLVDKEHQLMLESEPYAEVHEAKSHWWVNVLIACTALLDGILTRQSLTMIESNNNLMQIILLVILVALFMAIPYGVFHLFHLTKTSTYRVWIWGLCACFILAGLGGFAVLRNHYLHNLGATSLSMKAHTAVSVSPLVLFVIQLFSLFVGLLLVFLQSAPELEHRQKHARRFDESLAGVREDILVIERELASLPDEMYRSEVARSNRLSQEAGMEARIRAMFEYALGAFKESNINYRSDQEVPDCFSQHIEL